MKSLGATLLPSYLHERLQIPRWYVMKFIRDEAIPGMKPDLKVLDAGSGKIQEQLLRDEILATGAELHTCDLNFGPGVDFEADVSDMPFEDKSYDMVLCTQVLEHVRDPQKVVLELTRVLKPGGRLFLTVPQSYPMHNLPWNFFNYTNLGLRILVENAQLTIHKEQPQGGHYALLAFNLHWTVGELRRSSLPAVFRLPLMVLCQALFGFVFKVLLVWLDRFDKKPNNTLGWNFVCGKPEEKTGPA